MEIPDHLFHEKKSTFDEVIDKAEYIKKTAVRIYEVFSLKVLIFFFLAIYFLYRFFLNKFFPYSPKDNEVIIRDRMIDKNDIQGDMFQLL